MYGYASELLPYLQGLLGSDANAAGQPVQLPGAAKATPDQDTRGLAAVGANLMSASRRGQTSQQRQAALSNIPLPPQRPAGLLGASTGNVPQSPATDDERMRAFYAANGISTPPTTAPVALPGAMPRIDSGPAAFIPQGPTWSPQMPVTAVPLPPVRPQMGPPMPQGYAALPNGVPPGMALPQGQTFLSAPNSPQLNLPKGPTYMSAAPTNGSSTDTPFWRQYLYGK